MTDKRTIASSSVRERETFLSWLLALALLTLPSTLPQASPEARYQVPLKLGDGWSTAPADSVGVDSDRLASMTAAIRAAPELGVHAILIERDGSLIYEEYFDGFDERGGQPLGKVSMTMETRHDLRSVTKSVVSALVGIARAEGAIAALDQPLIAWFPEYPEADTPERRRVTLAHALSMTSGFEWNEDVTYTDPRNDETRMNRNPQPLRFALTRPFAGDPGRAFKYNGGLAQAMAAVVQRATKTPFQEYARAKLFEPLGITDVNWRRLGNQRAMSSSGLSLRPRDWAKLGKLVLNRGAWEGKQLVSASWIAQSTSPQVSAPKSFSYGFQWWLGHSAVRDHTVAWTAALGFNAQKLIVIPEYDTIVVFHASRESVQMVAPEIELLNRYILPALL